MQSYKIDGTQLWKKILYPKKMSMTEANSFPIGVTPSGSLFLIRKDVDEGSENTRVLRFSAEGKVSEGSLESTAEYLADFSLAKTEGTLDKAEFYAVGSSGYLFCETTPCRDTDAYLSLYTANEDEKYLDQINSGLRWTVR